MDYDVPFVNGDVVICGCEVECFVEKVLADGRVEFLDVKANNCIFRPSQKQSVATQQLNF